VCPRLLLANRARLNKSTQTKKLAIILWAPHLNVLCQRGHFFQALLLLLHYVFHLCSFVLHFHSHFIYTVFTILFYFIFIFIAAVVFAYQIAFVLTALILNASCHLLVSFTFFHFSIFPIYFARFRFIIFAESNINSVFRFPLSLFKFPLSFIAFWVP